MTAEQKAVFRRYVSIWQRGELDELPEVVTEDYVGPAATGNRGLDGLRDRISTFLLLYPDVRFVIEEQIAEGDRVATRMTASATSATTGKPVKLIGLNLSWFKDGRIAQEWPVWETLP